MKIIVSHDYLLKLANNNLTDEEILKGYFQYYFCQDRQLSDIKHDYFSARSSNDMNTDVYLFQSLTPEQIRKAIEKLENVLNIFLKTHFDLEIQNTLIRW